MKIAIARQHRLASIMVTALVVTAGASSATTTAHSAQADDVLKKKVSYAELNLESEDGAKVLYARLRSAAREVCAPLNDKQLSLKAAWQRCVDSALTTAVSTVNSSRVSALHDQEIGRSQKGSS